MSQTLPLHILLADDDEEDQEMLKEAITVQAPEAEISAVFNGQQALSFLNSRAQGEFPSLIILDYKMPILNGVETLERLFKDRRYTSIPVVVWSSSNQQEYIDKCIGAGALRFFTKPSSPKGLREMAETLLSLARTGS